MNPPSNRAEPSRAAATLPCALPQWPLRSWHTEFPVAGCGQAMAPDQELTIGAQVQLPPSVSRRLLADYPVNAPDPSHEDLGHCLLAGALCSPYAPRVREQLCHNPAHTQSNSEC